MDKLSHTKPNTKYGMSLHGITIIWLEDLFYSGHLGALNDSLRYYPYGNLFPMLRRRLMFLLVNLISSLLKKIQSRLFVMQSCNTH